MHDLVVEKRIGILDGFRAIAIIAVVLFHYYYRFGGMDGSGDFYQYDIIPLFQHGHFGVQLFFMVSGFVIYQSLEKSTTGLSFLRKRYFRLLPAIVLCSAITYFVVMSLNKSEELAGLRSETPLNFLFSFTFIHPRFWAAILDNNHISWIDGAYWSLWAEVVFYASASVVFFRSRKGLFLRNWLIIVLVLQLLRILTSSRLEGMTPEFILPISQAYYNSFLFLELSQWTYFTAGIVFYALWSKKEPGRPDFIIITILFLLQLYFINDIWLRVIFMVMIGLWVIFIYRSHWIKFFGAKPLVMIGLASYPLYLLHQNTGLVIIDRITRLGILPPAFVPVVVLLLMIVLGYLIFALYERPAIRYLRKKR
jgi:peptidoglycan/LPS O-acetylase OafA/YrhL